MKLSREILLINYICQRQLSPGWSTSDRLCHPPIFPPSMHHPVTKRSAPLLHCQRSSEIDIFQQPRYPLILEPQVIKIQPQEYTLALRIMICWDAFQCWWRVFLLDPPLEGERMQSVRSCPLCLFVSVWQIFRPIWPWTGSLLRLFMIVVTRLICFDWIWFDYLLIEMFPYFLPK